MAGDGNCLSLLASAGIAYLWGLEAPPIGGAAEDRASHTPGSNLGLSLAIPTIIAKGKMASACPDGNPGGSTTFTGAPTP